MIYQHYFTYIFMYQLIFYNFVIKKLKNIMYYEKNCISYYDNNLSVHIMQQ